MDELKALYEILGKDDTKKEVYLNEQKKRNYRAQKGYYTKTKGLFNFIQLIKDWENIVGPLMAINTIPLKIKAGTLYISTKHAIFAQELGFLAPEIIQKLKINYPDLKDGIKKIKFIHSNYSSVEFQKSREQKLREEPVKKTLHPFSPQYLEVKLKAEEMFYEIEDPEVKKTLIDYMLTQR